MKLLTVIIPSYNVELYLKRCLDSLLYNTDIIDKLDIIIVNDGSSDKTLEVAHLYQSKYKKSINVIDKKNGGYGSTINEGLKLAKGKYLKIIDADDWVNFADFGSFVNTLNELEDDILITNYQQDILYNSSVIKYDFSEYSDNKTHDINEISKLIDNKNFFFMFSMHSMAVKTSCLDKNLNLLEKTFYTDQQYVVKVLESAKTFRVLDFDIYRYFIGRPEQSVSAAGFFRHRQDHERVLRWILNEINSDHVKQAPYLKKVLLKQISDMINTHYEIYYQSYTATKGEIAELLKFNQFLKSNHPDIHRHTPASNRINQRLSPVRRYIKRKLLINNNGELK